MSNMKVMRLTENAVIPRRTTPGSIGFDVFSAYEYVVQPRGRQLILTDLCLEAPEGTYIRIAPRSGLALKFLLDVGGGVVDPDYRGNVGVLLFNFSDQPYKVERHDRVAQLICEVVQIPEVKEVERLDESTRGEGGFGSTGVK